MFIQFSQLNFLLSQCYQLTNLMYYQITLVMYYKYSGNWRMNSLLSQKDYGFDLGFTPKSLVITDHEDLILCCNLDTWDVGMKADNVDIVWKKMYILRMI